MTSQEKNIEKKEAWIILSRWVIIETFLFKFFHFILNVFLEKKKKLNFCEEIANRSGSLLHHERIS